MHYNLRFVQTLHHLFGVWSTLRFVAAHVTKRKRVKVFLRPIKKEIVCRPWTGDFAALRELFNYGPLPPSAQLAADCVVDLGANVGYATLFLKASYPQARILAVEPDPENFKILQENCGHCPGVTLFQCAISDKCGWLGIADASSDSVSRQFTIAAEKDNGIRALTLPQLMAESGVPKLDVIKIDIEGAEQQLFTDPTWLGQVKVVIIEFHGAAIEQNIKSILAAHHFLDQGKWGDKHVFSAAPAN